MSEPVDHPVPARPPRGAGRVVGVNLTWLVPGVVGGSEEYTVRLLEAVPDALGGDLRIRIYGRPDLVTAHPCLIDRHEFVPVPVLPGGRPGRVAVENTWLAARSRSDRIVHHAGGTVPFVGSAPAAVTVHDLQPLDHPDNFGPLKRHWLKRVLPHAVRGARLVLCPSEHTAQRLEALLAVPRSRVRVVPHGYRAPEVLGRTAGRTTEPPTGRTNRPAADPAGDVVGSGDETSGRFGRYLLYPAIAYPHKRHLDLIGVLDQLRHRHPDLSVVYTGRPGPESATLTTEADRLGLSSRVHQLGRVPIDELSHLYRGASALVFPSAYEGFGNPAVEAMGWGCPVVVSDAGALPEVVGDAGLVVPVGDVAALSAAVTRVLDEPGLADELGRRGRRRAARFDVAIAAATLADVYRELTESGPG
jgi:alpha-1,3-rhamnosyl/mannosyltransferase